MKVTELEGALLDYWVARAEELALPLIRGGVCYVMLWPESECEFQPSMNWSVCGPIIEREKIDLRYRHDVAGAMRGMVFAQPRYKGKKFSGPSPLIAAMRAYVASKFGEEVPDIMQ